MANKMDKINDKANRYEEMTRKYGDPWIWGIYFMLVLISIVETYSASSREVATMGVYMPIVKHCFFLLLGGIVLFFVHKIPYNNKAFLFGITVGLFVITLASLVYVQFFGDILNGARRSFRLFGISIQPSEFAKLAVVTSLSLILSRTQKENGVSNIGMWGCVAVVGVFSLFTFKSGLTNFLLLVGISLIMMVVGGISFKKIGILLLAFSILGGGFKYINHINEQKEENIQLAAMQNGERVINEGEATEEAYLTAELVVQRFAGVSPHRRQKCAGNVLTHGASPWRRYGRVLRQFAREQPSAIGVQRLYLLHHRGGHWTYRRHLCGAALPVPARTRGNDCTPMPTHTAHPHRDRHRVDDHAASVLPHGHQHGRVPCVGPAIATDFERWYVNHNYKLRLCHSAEHQPHRGRLN